MRLSKSTGYSCVFFSNIFIYNIVIYNILCSNIVIVLCVMDVTRIFKLEELLYKNYTPPQHCVIYSLDN